MNEEIAEFLESLKGKEHLLSKETLFAIDILRKIQ